MGETVAAVAAVEAAAVPLRAAAVPLRTAPLLASALELASG